MVLTQSLPSFPAGFTHACGVFFARMVFRRPAGRPRELPL
jgi:hypothetical protein